MKWSNSQYCCSSIDPVNILAASKMNSTDTVIAEVSYFTAIDYALLVIIMSFSMGIGIYFAFFSKKLKTTDDYLVGGRKMKPLPIAISLVARCVLVCLYSIFKRNKSVFSTNYMFKNLQPIVSTIDRCYSSRNLFVWLAVYASHSNSICHHNHCESCISTSVLSK